MKYTHFKDDFPAYDWFSITPADGTNLSQIPRKLYVGGAGDVAIVSKNGSSVVLSSVPAGTVIPVQPVEVSATGTTATNIIGLI